MYGVEVVPEWATGATGYGVGPHTGNTHGRSSLAARDLGPRARHRPSGAPATIWGLPPVLIKRPGFNLCFLGH